MLFLVQVISENVQSIGNSIFGVLNYAIQIYCPNGSYAWNWFTNNGYAENLIDTNQSTVPDTVLILGTVTSANNTPIPDVYVILQNDDESDYRTAITDYNGRWSATVVKDRVYEIAYASFDYIVTGNETSITATDSLTLTATAAINAEANNGISFKMKQNENEVTQIVVGSSVDFEVTTPETATGVRLIVDGIAYEEYALTDHQAAFSRVFSSSGALESGERQIQMQIFVDGEWSEMSAARTLTVVSNGTLDVPANIRLGTETNEHVINTPLTVYWDEVANADSYTVYVYCSGVRVWPGYGREIANARTNKLFFEIPAEAFPVADDHYSIQIVTTSTVVNNVGYNSSTGYLEPIIVKDDSTNPDYESWTGYVKVEKLPTYTNATSSDINGYVDNVDPVTVLDEQGNRYFIEMLLYSGKKAYRWVDQTSILKPSSDAKPEVTYNLTAEYAEIFIALPNGCDSAIIEKSEFDPNSG